ncbi:MAG TPA: YceI family protein [Methylomirabilota bacterium]|nr:YceI family protein [Methylomirabilota bacterium]
MRRRRALALISSSLLLAACGGSASLATASPSAPATIAPTAAPATSAPATPTPTAAGAGWTVTAASKAVVSVREQLVGVSLPSDAVLTATGATGTFKPNADGTFSADSKITFDVTTLASDNRDRDNFVKMDTLQTRQFPKADFVPTKATGLTLPLATTGTFTFKLTGNLTIHGKTKAVTFDVVAKRNGGDLTATATLSPSVKFGDFGMTAPSVPFRVVSIVDEIRLVVELVATGAGA